MAGRCRNQLIDESDLVAGRGFEPLTFRYEPEEPPSVADGACPSGAVIHLAEIHGRTKPLTQAFIRKACSKQVLAS